jgi:hypothetical protein
MRKAFGSLLQFIVAVAIGVGCVGALLSGMVAAAMVVGWIHDGKLHEYERPILVKSVSIFLASTVAIGVIAWLYRRFNPDDAKSLRLVESRRVRSDSGSHVVLIALTAAFAWLVWGMIPAGPFRIPILAMWTIAGLLAFHTHIVLHELGHFLAARVLGFWVRGLYVGTGPLLASIPLARGELVWRLWPLFGFVSAFDPRHRNHRIRQTVFIASGPLMDALVLGGSYCLIMTVWGDFSGAFTHSTGSFVISLMFFQVLLTAVGGVLPRTVVIGGRKLQTDGALLLKTWLAPKGVVGFTSDPSWLEALPLLQPAPGNGETRAEFGGIRITSGVSFLESQLRLRSRLRPSADLVNA